MSAHLVALAQTLKAALRADDLPTAARVLRRLEWEIAREMDRRNAPRAVIVARHQEYSASAGRVTG